MAEENIMHQMPYAEALLEQQKQTESGQVGWILFCCPSTITLGNQAKATDVLVSHEVLKQRGVTLLPVSRGGQVTYHGPGQIIGFPTGTLQAHTGDSRGVRIFATKLLKALKGFIAEELQNQPGRTVDFESAEECAGVWIYDQGLRRKIVALGLRFRASGIEHGFALNVDPIEEFQWINPCGEINAQPGSLFLTKRSDAQMQGLCEKLLNRLNREMKP